MHLGTLLETLRREGDAGLALAALDDIVLYSRIASSGAQYDETPAQYVASAASRFANQAGHEEWLQLVSAIGRSQDVGKTVLTNVVRWALEQDQEPSEGSEPHGSCSCKG